jgi:Ran GTPase-activating protein (RanGAP) involved in mRNA processing and transport
MFYYFPWHRLFCRLGIRRFKSFTFRTIDRAALATNNVKPLKEIYLNYNQLDTRGAEVALDNTLRQNHSSMRVLQLNSNHLGGIGGQVLALALRHNTTLYILMGLSRNHLEEP